MVKRTRQVPEQVHRAASSTWSRFRDRIDAVPHVKKSTKVEHWVDPDAGKSPEQRMVEKIRRRMQEYPDWYETDPARVARLVSRELERIGGVLEDKLPGATEPVEVWQIPLSVFNWLTDGGSGFVHGALKAWSSAELFNASMGAHVDPDHRDHLRQPFLDLAPILLEAVLTEMLKTDLWITFAEKFVGPELKYLTMRVQKPG